MKKYFFLYCILTLLLAFLVGCTSAKASIDGPNVVSIGSTIELKAHFNSNEPIVWRSSNKDIATVNKGIVNGISAGEVNIYASCGKEEASIKIRVLGEKEIIEEVDPYQNKALSIISNMTIEQKIGELFMVGVSDTISNEQAKLIKSLNIGNLMLAPNKSWTYQEMIDYVTSAQNLILTNNIIPGFIMSKKEGAYKLLDSLAIIPSSITILATGNEENAYKVAYGFGNELRTFGFNAVLSPNMLLSDLDENSYLFDATITSKYTLNEIDGYNYAGVMAIGCSFPGTGEDRWDGVPMNPRGKEDLMEEEMLPFIKAFEQGIDAIMLSNVIFSIYDNTYPATLSYPIATTLLRDTLGYKGLALSGILDEETICDQYREREENMAVLSLQAGADMLVYNSFYYVQEDYDAILKAVNDKKIDEKMIDQSLLRIILAKNKYDILENNHYMPAWNASEYDPAIELQTASAVVKESISLLDGSVPEIKKEDKILIASPIAQSQLDEADIDSNENSFAYVLYKNLVSNGYTSVEWITFNPNDRWQMREISYSSEDYDFMIFAISVVNGRTRLSFEDNGILVSLSTPIDTSRIDGIACYISAYGYERINVDAVADCLFNGAKLNDRREIDGE